jgi:hypothetical protein
MLKRGIFYKFCKIKKNEIKKVKNILIFIRAISSKIFFNHSFFYFLIYKIIIF